MDDGHFGALDEHGAFPRSMPIAAKRDHPLTVYSLGSLETNPVLSDANQPMCARDDIFAESIEPSQPI